MFIFKTFTCLSTHTVSLMLCSKNTQYNKDTCSLHYSVPDLQLIINYCSFFIYYCETV